MNPAILETQEIRKVYKSTEQLVLVLMIFALPLFGMVYLYFTSGNLNWGLPVLPDSVFWSLVVFNLVTLVVQYILFHQKIRLTFQIEDLESKSKIYLSATRSRFLILFLVSIFSSVGLLFFKSPAFVFLFAVTLVFFSLAKPSPDRMSRLMKLKKEQRDLLKEATRPDF
jgi:ACR3 family arsenite efflux pump ArsB